MQRSRLPDAASEMDVYENPESFPFDPVILGFVLDLREIWDVKF